MKVTAYWKVCRFSEAANAFDEKTSRTNTSTIFGLFEGSFPSVSMHHTPTGSEFLQLSFPSPHPPPGFSKGGAGQPAEGPATKEWQ